MNKQRLSALLAKDESTKLDYKEKLSLKTESEKKELAKDVSAIANSKGGRGYIIFGVEDKSKRIIGIETLHYAEEQIQQIISQRCAPPISVKFDFVDYNNKTIGVLTIYKSSSKPHQILQTGSFYIRRGSTTDIARREEIAAMLQELGLIQQETISLNNVDVDQLDSKLLVKYLDKSGLGVKTEKFESIYPLFEGLGILARDDDNQMFHPTIGGLMIFGHKPQQFLPYTGIKIINGEKEETCYVEGSIIKMLDEAEDYLTNIIKKPNYPYNALFEAVCNAVIHRDYFAYGREIVIYISNNKIEISNPGALCGDDEIHVLMEDCNPCRRNSWLYHRVLVLDDKKRLLKTGSSLKRINNEYKEIGKVKFISNKKRNIFKVILPGGFKD